ncbi:MAG: thioredoxin family protein [Bacteroidia bacterium]|nr:thioredoxin family protein [Bacteroidia bacterium]
MIKLIATVLAGMALAPSVWLTNFDGAKQEAAAEHKYILLNFSGSDWCAPCIKLKQEVFEREAFQKVADARLVLVRADFPRLKKNQLPKEQVAHNEKLAEQYNPDGKFPLTLLLDQDGKVIKSWEGYVFASQDKFMEELKTAVR